MWRGLVNDEAVTAVQADTLPRLAKHIPAGSTVAMLDWPLHKNAGDSLISLGQLGYLEQLGARPTFISDIWRFDAEDVRRRTDGPILLQGGGNLGDLWGYIQEFREHVIATCPDRPIVQMPQSIHFRDPANIARARRVFESHPELTLLLRDHEALDLARRLFPDTRSEFCPDMAFGVGALDTRWLDGPEVDVVRLLRRDREEVPGQAAELPPMLSSRTYDWHLPPVAEVRWRALRLLGQVARRLPPGARSGFHSVVHPSYEHAARLNVRQAVKTLGRGRMVVTNRLHGAVLAGLMGRPFVALDNTYGKVSAAFVDYLHTLHGANFASTPGELGDILEDYFNR